jgi:hypothetical protein
MPIKPMTREECLATVEQWEGDLGLEMCPIESLAFWCQMLGQSGRGTRPELVKRLRKLIA